MPDHKEAGWPWTGDSIWVTSIGNEVGQIVTSVLVSARGASTGQDGGRCNGAVPQGCHSTPSAALCGLWLLRE